MTNSSGQFLEDILKRKASALHEQLCFCCCKAVTKGHRANQAKEDRKDLSGVWRIVRVVFNLTHMIHLMVFSFPLFQLRLGQFLFNRVSAHLVMLLKHLRSVSLKSKVDLRLVLEAKVSHHPCLSFPSFLSSRAGLLLRNKTQADAGIGVLHLLQLRLNFGRRAHHVLLFDMPQKTAMSCPRRAPVTR